MEQGLLVSSCDFRVRIRREIRDASKAHGYVIYSFIVVIGVISSNMHHAIRRIPLYGIRRELPSESF